MMHYGSPFYILSIVSLLVITALVWFILKKQSTRTQKTVLFILMLLNALQHFFKFIIYPQYYGTGVSYISTAYNMCAVLIISSPAVLLLKSRFLKNCVFYIGAVAGLGAIAMPVWFIGLPVSQLGWEYVRFYICHGLLFISSILVILLNIHRASYKAFWQIGLGFLLGLCIILVNDVIFMTVGLFPGVSAENLYESLVRTNPCMMMGPQEGFGWVADIVKYFSPSFFMGNNPAGKYAPILWYAIPAYLGICLISFSVFAVSDWKNLHHDASSLLRRRKG